MMVKIKVSNEDLGIKEGEIYKTEPYWLDPYEKVSFIERIPDGYGPKINQYYDTIEPIH